MTQNEGETKGSIARQSRGLPLTHNRALCSKIMLSARTRSPTDTRHANKSQRSGLSRHPVPGVREPPRLSPCWGSAAAASKAAPFPGRLAGDRCHGGGPRTLRPPPAARPPGASAAMPGPAGPCGAGRPGRAGPRPAKEAGAGAGAPQLQPRTTAAGPGSGAGTRSGSGRGSGGGAARGGACAGAGGRAERRGAESR